MELPICRHMSRMKNGARGAIFPYNQDLNYSRRRRSQTKTRCRNSGTTVKM